MGTAGNGPRCRWALGRGCCAPGAVAAAGPVHPGSPGVCGAGGVGTGTGTGRARVPGGSGVGGGGSCSGSPGPARGGPGRGVPGRARRRRPHAVLWPCPGHASLWPGRAKLCHRPRRFRGLEGGGCCACGSPGEALVESGTQGPSRAVTEPAVAPAEPPVLPGEEPRSSAHSTVGALASCPARGPVGAGVGTSRMCPSTVGFGENRGLPARAE